MSRRGYEGVAVAVPVTVPYVRYSIRGTNNPRSLVFPFYVIPSHEDPDALGAGTSLESDR